MVLSPLSSPSTLAMGVIALARSLSIREGAAKWDKESGSFFSLLA